MKEFYLRIAGVGGQGVVHLATTISSAAADSGIPVSCIDRPRSAMRLGPITCDVCFGQTSYSPFIVPGTADAVLGMEPLDGTLNAAYFLKHGGTLILQARPTPTIEEVVSGKADVRRVDWKADLEARGAKIIEADPAEITGAGRNYYMLGVLLKACPEFPLTSAAIEKELADQPINLAFFKKGLLED